MKNDNDKNIYDMLNDIDVDLNEYDIEDFNDIEKIKIKKQFRESIGKKKSATGYKKYASVASIAIVSLAIIAVTPLGTSASKIISDLVFDIKSALRMDIDEENYIKVINKSITKEDITFRLNEAILNNDELIVSLTTISEEKIPKDMSIWREGETKVHINGELIDAGEVSSQAPANRKNIDEVIFFKIDTDRYSGVIDVKIEFGNISILRENKNRKLIKERIIEGPFVFEFDFDTTKINKNIKEIDINKTIDFKNGSKIIIDKYVHTPLSQKIYYTKNDKSKEEMDIILIGEDSLGNEVKFESYSEANGKGQLVANTSGKQTKKDVKYINLVAYKREYIYNGKELKEKLTEIDKDIKIDLTLQNK